MADGQRLSWPQRRMLSPAAQCRSLAIRTEVSSRTAHVLIEAGYLRQSGSDLEAGVRMWVAITRAGSAAIEPRPRRRKG